MVFTTVIKKGEKQFVALCLELDVVSQGFTVEAAIANLKEAIELYIEEMGVSENSLQSYLYRGKFLSLAW